MNESTVEILTKAWSDLSDQALSLQKVPRTDMQRLLKETYEALSFYYKDGVVPKAVVSLLFEMDHYLYFSTLMKSEEPDCFPYYKAVSSVVNALEKGFFQGEYEYPFPVLKVYDVLTEQTHIIDLENGSLEELL